MTLNPAIAIPEVLGFPARYLPGLPLGCVMVVEQAGKRREWPASKHAASLRHHVGNVASWLREMRATLVDVRTEREE